MNNRRMSKFDQDFCDKPVARKRRRLLVSRASFVLLFLFPWIPHVSHPASREMRKRGSTKSSKDDQMNELRKRRAGAQNDRDLRRSRDYTDEDEDKEEDEDDRREEEVGDEKPSDRKRKSTVPPLTATDMNSIRLKRDSLDKWVNEAYFDDIVKGFFVRVGMGISNGKRVYRVALIDGSL